MQSELATHAFSNKAALAASRRVPSVRWLERKVLLVDDAPEARLILRRILTKDGFRVLEASSGAEALDLLRQNADIGLVLLDLVIPDMDGYSVLQQLETMPAKPKVCVISALSDKSAVEKALALHADDYLAKPIFPRDVVYKVRSLLGAPAPADPGSEAPCRLKGSLGDHHRVLTDVEIHRISENGVELKVTHPRADLPEHMLLVCPALWRALSEFDDCLGGLSVRLADSYQLPTHTSLRLDFVGLSADARKTLRAAVADFVFAKGEPLLN